MFCWNMCANQTEQVEKQTEKENSFTHGIKEIPPGMFACLFTIILELLNLLAMGRVSQTKLFDLLFRLR